MSMGVFGVCNILIGLVLGMNRLSGKTHKTTEVPTVGQGLPPYLVYVFTFVTGGATIALEVSLCQGFQPDHRSWFLGVSHHPWHFYPGSWAIST